MFELLRCRDIRALSLTLFPLCLREFAFCHRFSVCRTMRRAEIHLKTRRSISKKCGNAPKTTKTTPIVTKYPTVIFALHHLPNPYLPMIIYSHYYSDFKHKCQYQNKSLTKIFPVCCAAFRTAALTSPESAGIPASSALLCKIFRQHLLKAFIKDQHQSVYEVIFCISLSYRTNFFSASSPAATAKQMTVRTIKMSGGY